MDCEKLFSQRVDALRAEGRYRVFADLERRAGDFPRAFEHRTGDEVTVWCAASRRGSVPSNCLWHLSEERIRVDDVRS